MQRLIWAIKQGRGEGKQLELCWWHWDRTRLWLQSSGHPRIWRKCWGEGNSTENFPEARQLRDRAARWKLSVWARALLLLENGQGKNWRKREGEEVIERWIALERRAENEKGLGKGCVSAAELTAQWGANHRVWKKAEFGLNLPVDKVDNFQCLHQNPDRFGLQNIQWTGKIKAGVYFF